VTPDQLIAAYHRASELGERAALDAQRYADARCVALYALAVEHDESLSTISARVGLTRARVQQMTARGRSVGIAAGCCHAGRVAFPGECPWHGDSLACVLDLPLAEGKTREQPAAL
jgi:hypothetical protein